MLLMSERRDIQGEPVGKTYKANGRALKSYRERVQLTLKGLESASGISYTQISRIENGYSKSPRWETLRCLADALGRDVDDLVIYEGIADVFSEENIERLGEKQREHDQRHQDKQEASGEFGEASDTGDRTR